MDGIEQASFFRAEGGGTEAVDDGLGFGSAVVSGECGGVDDGPGGREGFPVEWFYFEQRHGGGGIFEVEFSEGGHDPAGVGFG